MRKFLKTATSLCLCLALGAGILTGCGKDKAESTQSDAENEKGQTESSALKDEESESSTETATPDPAATETVTRAQYQKQLKKLETSYQQDTKNAEAAMQYMQVLHALGDIDKEEEVLAPFMEEESPTPDMMYRAASIAYLKGDYTEAQRLYDILIQNKDYEMAAAAGLQQVYYQTNQFTKAKEGLPGEDGFENPIWDMMKIFDEDPYQLNWNGKEQTTIPFVTTDPLPVVPIMINGKKMNAMIDTGGAMLVVDKALESELGLEAASQGEGSGNGGTQDIFFGKAESMQLGDVDIKNIPVMTMSFEGFDKVFEGYASDVHAAIGTNLLQQFIPTMDYLSGELVLVPRDEAGRETLKTMQESDMQMGETSFVLSSLNYMYAKGSINGHGGLNLFVNNGMTGEDGSESGIMLSKETMDLLGIPMPELKAPKEGEGGMGGSDYKTGVFNLSSYGIGDLQLGQGMGEYIDQYDYAKFNDGLGYIADAVIGHHYLKQYKWTIDFEEMKMTFHQ